MAFQSPRFIYNKYAPQQCQNRVGRSIPDEVKIGWADHTDGNREVKKRSVFAKVDIEKGTKLGPFEGTTIRGTDMKHKRQLAATPGTPRPEALRRELSNTLNSGWCWYSWDRDEFITGEDATVSNYLRHLKTTATRRDNLEPVPGVMGRLYFETTRKIRAGDEMTVSMVPSLEWERCWTNSAVTHRFI